MHTKEMVFQQNLLENAYLITKMCGSAMVRPASSDFWKAPIVRCSPSKDSKKIS